MKIAACRTLLCAQIAATAVPAPEFTPLGKSAGEVLGMAQAYANDGTMFYQSGDLVNALASYFYGSGWLHFGYAAGLLVLVAPVTPSCPFQDAGELLPAASGAQLEEKTRRYARLLDTARASVVTAPEPATVTHEFAGQVEVIVSAYAAQGRRFLDRESREDALACFSYGYGWLDAGVRTGLFRITGDRDIFTV
ncbi:MAG: DUF357 domain-containing protein [Methanoregula sp.]|jgi:hypothetical protein